MTMAQLKTRPVVSAVIAAVIALFCTVEKASAFSPRSLQHRCIHDDRAAGAIITPQRKTTPWHDVVLNERRNINENLSESISDGISNFDLTEVIDNVKGDGNAALFERGELYFVAQAVLLLLIAIGGVPLIDQPLRVLGGPGLILGGLGIGGLAVLDLGSDSLSPFPSPPDDGDLKTSGIYSKMRHPMYTSLLMISCGLAIFSNSADRLLLTAILAYLLEIKSSKEEDFLVGKYGIYYTQYMEEVPGKFLPADLIGSLPWNKKGDA